MSILERIIRYGMTGLLAAAIYFTLLLTLVDEFGVAPVTAAAIATAIAAVTSYLVHRTYVFVSDRSHASAFPRFLVTSLLGMAVNMGLMRLATGRLAWPYLAGAALSTAVVPPMNFMVNYFWAFRAIRNDAR